MNIPSHLVNKLMQESQSFRDYIIDIHSTPEFKLYLESIEHPIKRKVHDIITNASHKIKAITDLLNLVTGDDKIKFIDAYPQARFNDSGRLSLVYAKEFVESFRQFHPM